MLPVSLDCSFLIAPSVFYNVNFLQCETKEHGIRKENSFSAASWFKPFNKASAVSDESNTPVVLCQTNQTPVVRTERQRVPRLLRMSRLG